MAETTTSTATPTIAADLDTSGPADIAAATAFTPAGAPEQVTEIDVDHPAVDNNPRANTTVDMNRADFNDPRKTGAEIADDAAAAIAAKAKAKG